MPKIDNPFDQLQVSIPGMQRFKDAVITANPGGGYNLSITWIGDYLAGLYQFLIMVVAIFAAVAFLIGATLWMTSAGSPSRVGEAKSWMTSSILGLVLALSSYLILYTVSPELVILRPINLGHIERSDIDGDYTFASEAEYRASASGRFTPGSNYTSNTYAIPCPPQARTLPDFVSYYLNSKEITYRMSPDRGSCQGGECYFDCSSFAQHLAMCLGLNAIAGEGYTGYLFRSADNNRQPLNYNLAPDSYLKPGDIVGYAGNPGHVLTYIGNNRLIEVGGEHGQSLIQRYGAVKVTNFQQRLAGYAKQGITIYYINR